MSWVTVQPVDNSAVGWNAPTNSNFAAAQMYPVPGSPYQWADLSDVNNRQQKCVAPNDPTKVVYTRPGNSAFYLRNPLAPSTNVNVTAAGSFYGVPSNKVDGFNPASQGRIVFYGIDGDNLDGAALTGMDYLNYTTQNVAEYDIAANPCDLVGAVQAFSGVPQGSVPLQAGKKRFARPAVRCARPASSCKCHM
jgi:hypothetical protein